MVEDGNASKTGGATPLSWKDLVVLVTMATFGAAGLAIAWYGQKGLADKCTKSEFWGLISILLTFAAVILMITYLLVYLAAHCVVYIGIRLLITLLDPVNPQRVRRTFNRIFYKNKEQTSK